MNLPSVVTSRMLAPHARPEENMAIRCILRRIANLTPYTVRGKLRHYIFEYDSSVGAHVLDVPVTVWNAGIVSGTYRDNTSVAHDMQACRSPHLAPLVFMPIPFGNQEAGIPATLVIPPPDENYDKTIAAFGNLLNALDAPQEAIEAIEILKLKDTSDEARAAAITMISHGIVDLPPEEVPEPIQLEKQVDQAEKDRTETKRIANADKMRKHRAKKRAEKEVNTASPIKKRTPVESLV